MLKITHLLFSLAVLCYFMYKKVMKSPKTWEDYAEIGLIIVLMLVVVLALVVVSS